jgi:hypothetical protein
MDILIDMNTLVIVILAIAIFSSVISIVNAIVPTWLTRLHANRTETAKSNAYFNTYKEPVLIAAIDLAHELYNFLDAGTKNGSIMMIATSATNQLRTCAIFLRYSLPA